MLLNLLVYWTATHVDLSAILKPLAGSPMTLTAGITLPGPVIESARWLANTATPFVTELLKPGHTASIIGAFPFIPVWLIPLTLFLAAVFPPLLYPNRFASKARWRRFYTPLLGLMFYVFWPYSPALSLPLTAALVLFSYANKPNKDGSFRVGTPQHWIATRRPFTFRYLLSLVPLLFLAAWLAVTATNTGGWAVNRFVEPFRSESSQGWLVGSSPVRSLVQIAMPEDASGQINHVNKHRNQVGQGECFLAWEGLHPEVLSDAEGVNAQLGKLDFSALGLKRRRGEGDPDSNRACGRPDGLPEARARASRHHDHPAAQQSSRPRHCAVSL